MKTPHMDGSGVIQFPAPEEPELDVVAASADDIDEAWDVVLGYEASATFHVHDQANDMAEIEATDLAVDLARDFLATLERRGLFSAEHMMSPARQAINVCAEYILWRRGRAEGESVPDIFKGIRDDKDI